MDAPTVLALVLLALTPPFILAFRLRNAELHRREPWLVLSRAFAWGASVAAILSIVMERTLDARLAGASIFLPAFSVTVVLVAPLVEELSKALGLRLIRDPLPEVEDGYIYGGAVGLGFAATENVIYVLSALAVGGQDVAATTALYRGIATVALHGAASAVAGHGIWRARYGHGRWWAYWGVGAAVVMHVSYNALAVLALPWATLAAVALALVMYMRMMRRVRVLDAA